MTHCDVVEEQQRSEWLCIYRPDKNMAIRLVLTNTTITNTFLFKGYQLNMGGWNIGSGKLSRESVGTRRDMWRELFGDALAKDTTQYL